MNEGQTWLVELELKRIQTYLFAVPRLSVMVGANAIMGETLRGKWDGASFGKEPITLPALAQECGSAWPTGIPAGQDWVSEHDDVLTRNGVWQDDVAKVAATGMLTRDGGHFEAVFPSDADRDGRANAVDFLGQAQELVAQKLPGVTVAARLFEIVGEGSVFKKAEALLPLHCHAGILDLPQAETCQYSGREPASTEIREGGAAGEERLISKSVDERRDRSQAFDKGTTFDVLGILRSQLLEAAGLGANREDKFPGEFRELSTQGYLAVVHVDGNGVGKRFTAHMDAWKQANTAISEDFFAHWAEKERFFQRQRCLMRQSVLGAIRTTFGSRDDRGPVRNRHGKAPLRLLMLGGDDLLLVCGAPYALPFVVELARELRDRQSQTKDPGDSNDRLTIGAGVAIVQDSFPFHRAHQLAEQLTESAKRLKSSPRGGDGNLVDWLVTSEAWHGDVADTRRRHAVLDQQLVLTGKPYRILREQPDGCPPGKSLEDLLKDAQVLHSHADQQRAARSQLHRMVDSLRDGRLTARFVAETLPAQLRKQLRGMSYLSQQGEPWIPVGDEKNRKHLTQLADMFELYELERLEYLDAGHAAPASAAVPNEEVVHV